MCPFDSQPPGLKHPSPPLRGCVYLLLYNFFLDLCGDGGYENFKARCGGVKKFRKTRGVRKNIAKHQIILHPPTRHKKCPPPYILRITQISIDVSFTNFD